LNVKKSLQSHIRGWFPQEPRITTILKANYRKTENNQPPLIIPSEYTLSTTKFTAGYAIFWIVFYGFMFFTSINLEKYDISGLEVGAWLIAGLAVGAISFGISTKNLLRRLLKDYRSSVSIKDMILLIAPILLGITGLFVSYSIYGSNMRLLPLQGFLISVYAWGFSAVITRVTLLVTFEKRENMRIMQSWFRNGFVLIPKPPNSKVNLSETTAKQV